MEPDTAGRSAALEALGRWGFEAPSLAAVGSGRVNSHWLIRWPGVPANSPANAVLRRYHIDRTPAAISFEHDLLGHLAGAGWPVAKPIATASGGQVVEAEGARWSLFPFLPGASITKPGPALQRIRGRLLARFHREASTFPHHEQRDGFGRVWELDVFTRPANDSFNGLLAAFGRDHPDLAGGVRRERYRNLRELARLGYGERPNVLVHGGFGGENLLFEGGTLSGLPDLDLVRWDAAPADLAVAILIECTTTGPDHDAIDIDLARAFLEGYAAGRPLTLEDAQLIAPLVRAALLWGITVRLIEFHRTGSDDAARDIAQSVHRRFPALAAKWTELQRVAEGVASR